MHCFSNQTKLEEVIEVIDEGKMPLKQYVWIHNNAGISEEQGKLVIEWARLTKALYELGPQPR